MVAALTGAAETDAADDPCSRKRPRSPSLVRLEGTPEGARSGKPSTVGPQNIVVTQGAGCELDTVLALESCYLALLLNRPPAELERIKIILGRFAHGIGASGAVLPP